MSLDIAVTAGLALVLGLVLLPLSRAVLVACSVVFVTLSSPYFLSEGEDAFGIAVRVVAFVVLLRLSWPVRSADRVVDQAQSLRDTRAFVPLLLLAMLGYLVAATWPHGLFQTLVLYAQAVALAFAYSYVIARFTVGQDLLNGVLGGLAVVVGVSWLLVLVAPGEALLGGRLRGLTSNPNFLGYCCAVVLALLVLSRRKAILGLVLAVPSLGALVFTGSRGSLLVVAIVCIGWLALRHSAASRIVALMAATAGVALLVAFPESLSSEDAFILRTNNSREDSLEYTLQVLRIYPYSGLGLNGEQVTVASSPLRALVHAGYPGGVAVLVMYCLILLFSWRAGKAALIFAIAMIAHSLLEGWLLSPVSPILLIFIAAWYALRKARDTTASETPVQPPVRRRVRVAH
jgi:hypothetical protein